MKQWIVRTIVPVAAIMLCVLIAKVNHPEEGNSFTAPARAATQAAPVPHRPTAFGLNLSYPAYWSNERAFMNLAAGGIWQAPHNGWKDFDPARIDQESTIRSLAPGEIAAMALVRPAAAYRSDVAITCFYDGKGVLGGIGVKDGKASPGRFDFTWPAGTKALIRLDMTDPADPVRHIDCREAGADRKAVFDRAFVDGLRPYKAIRYLDWQAANGNVAGNWAQRTLPTSTIQGGPQGVAVEYLVLLANQAKVDPWFVMPWNTDDESMERFATYVRDHLDPGRTAYVEIGNEIWNMSFPAARQALAEGELAKLGSNRDEARMRRYAQKVTQSFRIWERVFAGQMPRIVRILSGQNAWPELMTIALDYQDTASHLDALAMAPYFGQALLLEPPADTSDLGPLFAKLDGMVQETFVPALRAKQMADARGLRFLGYEGGQHITYSGKDATLIPRLNRDPRMADSYRKYLDAWDRQFGDMLMLLASSGAAGSNAAFGMTEYSGQPLSETPKRRAVLEAIERLKR